ncbi:hypothetical protein D3C73_942290 [compost metagenome]
MRPEQAAPGRRVAGAGAHQAFAQRFDDVGLVRARRRHLLGRTGQSQVGLGEGAVGAGVDPGLKRLQRPGARHRRPGAALGQPRLQRVQPQGIGRTGFVGQQTQPLAQGLFIGRDDGGVVGMGGEDQAVEEPQPLRPRVREQPVLLGRGPDGAQIVQQPSRRRRLAVDAHDAPRRGAHGLDAGAQAYFVAVGCLQRRRHGPGPPDRLARLAPSHLGRRRPAQPLAGGQQADRLQKVGLARPVRPMQHHRPAGNRQGRARIGAEVGEGEGGDHALISRYTDLA